MTLGQWWRRVSYLLNRSRLDRELREEMEAHREMLGSSSRFGNTLRLREESRDIWGWRWWDELCLDLRYSFRTLQLSPLFSLCAVLILSLGIGLNLTFFQLLNVTVLKPLPVRDPDSLVQFWRMSPQLTSTSLPYPAAQFYRQQAGILSAVLTQTSSEAVWGDDPEDRLKVSFVSANWFGELGYGAARGRVFSQEIEEAPGADPVVVVSHAFWEARLGGDPQVVGQTVRINHRPALLIGVADRDFPGLRLDSVEVWLPIHQIGYFQPGSRFELDWRSNSTNLYARLQPGVSPQAAREALRPVVRELARQRPDEFDGEEWLEPLSGSVRFQPSGDLQAIGLMSLVVAGLTGLVLLTACSNLGSLVLSRSLARLRELSLRTALGAGRWRVTRTLLGEIVLLTLLGSAGGLITSYWAARLIARSVELPSHLDFTPDFRIFLGAFGAALVVLIVVGLLPAWKVTRGDLSLAIKDGSQQASAGLGRGRLRAALLTAQIGGSCLLLVVTGLTVSGLQRILTLNPGFEFERLAVLNPNLAQYGIQGEAARSYWLEVKDALASGPEVEGVALASHAPLGSSLSQTWYQDAPGLKVTMLSVEPEFFSLLRIPILFGRGLEEGDPPSGTVVISRRLAVQMYGTPNAVGRGFPRSNPVRTVVGISGDAALLTQGPGQLAHYAEKGSAEQYTPPDGSRWESMILLARARATPADILRPLISAARSPDPRVLAPAWLLRTEFENKIRPQKLAGSMALSMSALSLALACLGIFAVVSYGAGLRAKEIAIRRVLGAGRVSIVRLLLGQLGWPVGLGVAFGMGGALLVARVLESVELALRWTDASGYLLAGLVLAASAGMSALPPALRALRSAPLHALRGE